MEFNKNIASIKDTYNPYSKSEYNNSYFTGDNSDWQYLQLGGIEKHIDISDVRGGTRVENSNNLSETLGLYYIAKAVKENKITKAIADDLGQYFISHSTLKDKIANNDLINNIISVIANNTDIFQLISKLSLVNNDINYHFNDWYSGFNSQNSVISDTYALLKWTDYVKDWDTFARVFSTFHFDNKSLLQVSTSYGEINAATLVSKTKNINAYQGTDNNNILFTVSINWGRWYIGNHIKLEFNIWHDDNNIYFKWFLNEDSHWANNLYADIFLNNVLFEI